MISDECIFCKIINGQIPATVIEETDTALAFRDINPQSPIHVLIIPKVHIDSCLDLNNNNINYLSEMALLAQKVASDEEINKSGYRWVINTGKDGGQTVSHIHLHLLGGRAMTWPPG